MFLSIPHNNHKTAMEQSRRINGDLGPVVQSIVSLTSSLVVKILTVLVSKLSNSHVFLLKNVSSFSHFLANILAYMPYLMIKVLTICSLVLNNNWALKPEQIKNHKLRLTTV